MRLSLLAGQHTGFFLAMAGERSVPGFQWEKYEAWRGHPLLKFQWRNAAPGFFLGLGAFAVYVVYDKATNDGKDHH